jgi:hypothetical protein
LQGAGTKKNNWKKWRTEEEERHKGLLTPKTTTKNNAHQIILYNRTAM